jgi:murein DD-endopeptidase MepM/ murein hydrolase activator NlpD
MTADDELLLLLLGGAVIMLGEKPQWGTGWHWPVPDLLTQLGRFPAVCTQEFHAGHRGVDIMLDKRGRSHDGKPVIMPGFPTGKKAADGVTTDATANYFAPKGLWVIAARAGKVWSVDSTVNGIMVVIDHGPPWATFYGHLDTCSLSKKGEDVVAGQIIGTVGAGLNTDPSKGLVDGQHLRHLHFEAWYKGNGNNAVDPMTEMQSWKRATWQTSL